MSWCISFGLPVGEINCQSQLILNLANVYLQMLQPRYMNTVHLWAKLGIWVRAVLEMVRAVRTTWHAGNQRVLVQGWVVGPFFLLW